jgi:hypothetical protein
LCVWRSQQNTPGIGTSCAQQKKIELLMVIMRLAMLLLLTQLLS